MVNPKESNAIPNPLRVRLLGAIDLQPNAAGPLTRGAREVLAYLALHGSSRRSVVATSIWPEVEETQALFYLRRALSELRKNLGTHSERILTPSQSVLDLNLDGVQVDVFRLRNLLQRQELSEALELHQAGFLDGVESPWATLAREELDAEVLKQFSQIGHLAAGMGDAKKAEEVWRQALQVKPADETIWQAIIRLRLREGDTQGAQSVFKECDAVLRANLGRSAGGRTRALLETASAGAALEFPSLPPVLGDIVGRQDFLADVLADLAPKTVVTLIGAGGVGKTRLAIEVARRAGSQFSDGVCFVELAPASSERVPDEIAKALGFRSPGGSPWRTALQSLGARRLLLVLDNAEHVLPAVARCVEEFLTAVPQSSVLVTSRTSLGLANETRKRMPSLEKATAYALFCQRARQASSHFQPSEAAEKLCALLDGIPLAIELTAAHAGSVPMHELSEELAKDLALDAPGNVRAGRHETMRAAILASVQAIPEELKDRFLRLSVFSGGFSLEAAMAVADLGPSKVATLIDRSLIEFDGSRYRMLEPVRQLSQELLRDAGKLDATVDRFVEFFGKRSVSLFDGPFLYDRDPIRFSQLRSHWTPEDPNMRQCLSILEERGEQFGDMSMGIWLVRIWFRVIDHSEQEAVQWLPRLETSPTDFVTKLQAWWWYTIGTISVWNDAVERGPALLRRVAVRCWELGFRDVHAEVAASMLAERIADPRTGEERIGYALAVDLFRDLGIQEAYLYARIKLAECVHCWDQTEDAYAIAAEVEQATARGESLRARIIALRLLAWREETLGAKLRLLREAINLQKAQGHWAEVHTWRAMARLLTREGDAADEIEAWKSCLECARRVGYRGSVAEAHLDIAGAYLRAGNQAEAWLSMATAVEAIVTLGRPVFLNQAIAILSGMALSMGDHKGAVAAYRYAQHAAERGEIDLNFRVQGQIAIVEEFLKSCETPAEESVRFSTPDDVIHYVQAQWSACHLA
jgi:predicted ATPase/DNA-binding SARP family transcriptional activator